METSWESETMFNNLHYFAHMMTRGLLRLLQLLLYQLPKLL